MNYKTAAAMLLAAMGTCAPVQAYEKGEWIVRAGIATVAPNDDSDNIVLPTAPQTVLDGVEVDDNFQLGILGAYMLSDHIGLELLAATPFKHNISIANTSLDAGSTRHLPPTLSLQWYPRGGRSGWQPYFGVGLNYTLFFDEETDGDLDGALSSLLGATDVDLDLDDSFGLAAQAGVDFPFSDRWSFNVGVWYIDIETTADVKTDVGTVSFDVDIDPWVYNIGLAYRF